MESHQGGLSEGCAIALAGSGLAMACPHLPCKGRLLDWGSGKQQSPSGAVNGEGCGALRLLRRFCNCQAAFWCGDGSSAFLWQMGSDGWATQCHTWCCRNWWWVLGGKCTWSWNICDGGCSSCFRCWMGHLRLLGNSVLEEWRIGAALGSEGLGVVFGC